MKKIAFLILIFLVFLIIYSQREKETKDDFAPGCEGKGGITGCLGKSGIKDIKVGLPVDCLHVKANNCNGGVLGIENRCTADLFLRDVIIPQNSYQLIEFIRDSNGSVVVLAPKGNFDSYNPLDEDTLSVRGLLGDLPLVITYTKKNICGEPKNPFKI